MTAQTDTRPTGARPADTATVARPPRRRVWPWVVSPFALLALLFTLTLLAHSAQTPDLDDPGTMSPTGTGRDGSSRLAALLRERGVTIHTVTSSAAATQLMLNLDATVFVPTPDLLSPTFADLAPKVPGRHRIVLVQPGIRSAPLWGFLPVGARWAATTTAPACGRDFAEAAGVATMAHHRYAAFEPTMDCYRHGLVGTRADGTEVIAVGASDPFRDGRIDEGGNAALALGLLAGESTVIWVDVHKAEPRPRTVLPRYQQPERGGDGGFPRAYREMPPALWSSLALLGALGVLLAFVLARRLGPPVREPLPVLIPATENVTGRGRLYARARAHGATLDALRAAAVRRLATALGPPGTTVTSPLPEQGDLVAMVAERSGWAPAAVSETLYGATPGSDAELTRAVVALDSLLHAAMHEQPQTASGAGTASGAPSTEEEHR
jgi:hypothetical protein